MKQAKVVSIKHSLDRDICVGVITAANGIKGYVKIKCFTESPTDMASFKKVFNPELGLEFSVKVISSKNDILVAKIDGVDNRNDAEKLRNIKLYIKRSELPPTKNNEFYQADLVGLTVLREDGAAIGSVINLHNYGAGDLIEIIENTTSKSILYPFAKSFIAEVNLEAGYVMIKPMDETAVEKGE